MGRLALALVAALLLWAVPAHGQIMAPGTQCPGLNNTLVAISNEALTVSNSAKALTLSKYATSNGKVAIAALLSVQAQPINAIDDGSSASTTTGAILEPAAAGWGGLYWVCGHSIGALSMIRNGGSDATVNIIYYASP